MGLERDDVVGQLAYVKENAIQIKRMMVNDSVVIFRDFDLMKLIKAAKGSGGNLRATGPNTSRMGRHR